MARVNTEAAIGLYLAWQLAMLLVILQRIASVGVGALADLWYAVLLNVAFGVFIAKQVQRRSRGEIQELLSLDLVDSLYPMLGSFAAHFAVLLVLYTAAGFHLAVPETSEILRQLFVVTPTETFVWIFFLPRTLGSYFGIPAWVWSSVSFGFFHVVAYNANLAAMAVAALFNMAWYNVYELRSKYKFLGLPAVWMSHFTINLFAIAAAGASVAYLILRALGIA